MIELSCAVPVRFDAARATLQQRRWRAVGLESVSSSTRASSGSFGSAPYSSASKAIDVNLTAMRPSRRCRVRQSS